MNLITFVAISYLTFEILQVYSVRIFCMPGMDYHVDCNRCWCLRGRRFLCTKMICKDVPQKFWSKIQLTAKQQPAISKKISSTTSVVIEVVKEGAKQVGAEIVTRVKEKALDIFMEVMEWVGRKLKDVGSWFCGLFG